MLKRRKVKDRETRLKLACLAITSSVLLPSSHTPRIIPEHVEISKDFDELLAYPWGRVSFKILVTNLLSKDEVSLSQSSVALKGFVDAIQHVLIANVPVLKEEVIPNEPVVLDDSESDSEDEETRYDGSPDPQPPSETPHVGVDVRCITDDPHENWAEGVDFGWDDEPTAGPQKIKDKETSEKQEKATIPESTEAESSQQPSAIAVSNIQKMKGALMEALKGYLSKASSSPGDDYVFLERHTGFLGARVSGASIPPRPFSTAAAYHKTNAREIIDGVIDDLNQQHNPARADDLVRCPSSRRNRNQATPDSQGVDKILVGSNTTAQAEQHSVPVDCPPPPSSGKAPSASPPSSKPADKKADPPIPPNDDEENGKPVQSNRRGLSQEEVDEVLVNVKPVQFFMPEEQVDVDFVKTRKSKRSRNMPAGYEDFQCDPKVGMGYDINPNIGGMFSNLQEELSKKEALKPQTIAPKIMDALMLFIGRQLPGDYEKVQIFDTTLPTSLVKNHSSYTRTSVKDRPKFRSSGLYVESLISQLLKRIYFPFNIDQQHWVGVFVDTKATTINVLDCYVAFKSDSLLKREFTVVANTMPYIVRVANGSDRQGSLKLYSLTRCKGVPQVSLTADAAANIHVNWYGRGSVLFSPPHCSTTNHRTFSALLSSQMEEASLVLV
ncbi:hypothetical protein F2Q69_00030338 [Brassica cretica]|uniref:Ubiquitin-like protease family profile domain-containing protein n=1 Tax=Brassica cretica TaxID=69181 RepID=A0A8S9RSM6_BRACR|nr:hypothetical protein F2Q69_00030338 [Brassica cretica]